MKFWVTVGEEIILIDVVHHNVLLSKLDALMKVVVTLNTHH